MVQRRNNYQMQTKRKIQMKKSNTGLKEVQVHTECPCGLHQVDIVYWQVKWKDFAAAGITVVKKGRVRKVLLLHRIILEECRCNEG